MASNVMLYTAPGCPDCAAVKQWLVSHGVFFREKDISQPGVADEAKENFGVRVAPITVVDDEAFYGTFAQQRPDLISWLG